MPPQNSGHHVLEGEATLTQFNRPVLFSDHVLRLRKLELKGFHICGDVVIIKVQELSLVVWWAGFCRSFVWRSFLVRIAAHHYHHHHRPLPPSHQTLVHGKPLE